MKIYQANLTDIPVIQHIVNLTWPIAYAEIISQEQLKYMLDLIYNTNALTKSINKKEQIFYIAKDEDEIVLGFFSIAFNYNLECKSKIHKIYILPQNQGKGIGKLLIEKAISLSREQKQRAVILNVNRFNKALHFYQKLGFEIIETIDIEIGNGYLMEDFVMQIQL